MRKITGWMLMLALCLGAALAGAEEAPVTPVPALELPEAENGEFAILTREEDPGIGPREEGYLFEADAKTPYGYADPSITVNSGSGRYKNTDYWYLRIRIADPSQIRVMTNEKSLAKVNTAMGSKLAERVRAVAAINGVLEADVSSGSSFAFVDGPVLHQGEWKRPGATASENKIANWKARESRDTLVIDDAGDLRVLQGETWGDIYEQILAMGDSAVNVLTFGPALIIDGEAKYGYSSRQMASHRPAQRAAICQTGPLEYLLIASESPENREGAGLELDEFTALLASFGNIQTAYNLDGGTSSTMVFRKGSEYWAKINSPGGKKRPLRDLIYFADAWIPETGAAQTAEPAETAGGEEGP